MIYIVEDDSSIRELVAYTLTSQGMEAEGFERPSAFFKALEKRTPELVLLDIMLPETDGLSVLKKLKGTPGLSRLPVIMLTARSEEYDKLFGFNLGADDYVSKPFSPKELMARVNAVLKRMGNAAGTILRFGDFCIQTAERLVKAGDKTISLPPKEFDLLVKLARNEHIVLKREQLLESVWGYEYYGDTRTVDTHIKSLREHLGEYRRLIQTVWGVGYKFEYKES